MKARVEVATPQGILTNTFADVDRFVIDESGNLLLTCNGTHWAAIRDSYWVSVRLVDDQEPTPSA